jgi:hypothetical protein
MPDDTGPNDQPNINNNAKGHDHSSRRLTMTGNEQWQQRTLSAQNPAGELFGSLDFTTAMARACASSRKQNKAERRARGRGRGGSKGSSAGALNPTRVAKIEPTTAEEVPTYPSTLVMGRKLATYLRTRNRGKPMPTAKCSCLACQKYEL